MGRLAHTPRPESLVAAYRNSVVHVSLISVLEETVLNWCRQEELRARMSDTVLFGTVKDPEPMVFNFRGQLQCRMGEKCGSHRGLPQILEFESPGSG